MLILANRRVPVDGVALQSWHDNPGLRLGAPEMRPRRTPWVRSVIVHTTQGTDPVVLRAGVGPDNGAELRTVRMWAADSRCAGAHIIIDSDGSAACIADLVTEATYHATSVNEVSIGIEIKQTIYREVWQVQLDVLVAIVDVVTRELGIQRQVHAPYRGPVSRLVAGGEDCVGVFGHRDQTNNRGPGDPGDVVMEAFAAASYERYGFHTREDLGVWRGRQQLLRGQGSDVAVDGVPGPATRQALCEAGRPHGLWVSRPGDGR